MSQVQDEKLKNLSPKELDLYKLRHTAEHVLTEAMINLYGTDHVIMAMGPATNEGFYFDFDTPEDFKISESDFKKIEKEMWKIINANLPMIREEISIDDAKTLFANNPYKKEWLADIQSRGESATIYRTGDQFVDLCSGPHADSTGAIKAFKLLSMAGAYWHGDEKNKMLTRIYGTAFTSKQELEQYLHNLEEAKKRDHKKLGKDLDLFTFSELVGSGLPLWTPKGTLMRNLLDNYVWQLRQAKGYQQVSIPHITKKDLFETSGHWSKFADELFKINTREGHLFAMKPMNCPFHTQIYAHKPRSYKDLPQRYSETTMVYRDEQSGELSGLSRVRCITQDDAHVFCRENQVADEANHIWDIIETFYQGCGFDKLQIRLSLHDPANPDAYLGTKEVWLQAEDQLRQLLHSRQANFEEAIGEAAFYGPKIDFMTQDSLGRQWQVATIQVDRNMPERFELTCVNEQGQPEQIVMIHAAIMGSIERFMSILIEHFAGAFPVWLSPVQTVIIPIGQEQFSFCQQLHQTLLDHSIRSELWTEDSMQKRIRLAEKQKIPYMLIVGQKEVDANIVSVRGRGEKDLGTLPVDQFLAKIQDEINTKTTSPTI